MALKSHVYYESNSIRMVQNVVYGWLTNNLNPTSRIFKMVTLKILQKCTKPRSQALGDRVKF